MQTKLKEQLVDCLTKYFKENLVSVVFFGSRARREAKPESDYDIFLVANELPKRILDRQSYVRKAISFKFEQKISIHAKTKAEFERGFPPLYLDLGLDALFSLWQAITQALQPVQALRSMVMPHWLPLSYLWASHSMSV